MSKSTKTGFSVNEWKSSKTLQRLKRNSRCNWISGWGELFSKWENYCPRQRGPKADCFPLNCPQPQNILFRLNKCLRRLNKMQISLWHQTRNRPMPLTSSVVWQMMARFRNFYNVKNVKTSLKRGSAFRTGAKIYLSKKIFWGYGLLALKSSQLFRQSLNRIIIG